MKKINFLYVLLLITTIVSSQTRFLDPIFPNTTVVSDVVYGNNITVLPLLQGEYVVNGISLAGLVNLSDLNGRSLIKVCDVLGREVIPGDKNKDNLLLYIYDDGSIERKYHMK